MNEREVLEMALVGYELKRADLEREVERVRLLLRVLESGEAPLQVEAKAKQPKRATHRHRSAETRAKMAAAQRQRWAHVKREKARARKGGRR